jgi:hypothetical protein
LYTGGITKKRLNLNLSFEKADSRGCCRPEKGVDSQIFILNTGSDRIKSRKNIVVRLFSLQRIGSMLLKTVSGFTTTSFPPTIYDAS